MLSYAKEWWNSSTHAIRSQPPSQQSIHVDDIFLANGASQAIHEMLASLIRPGEDAVIVPILQYPLYVAELVLANAHIVKYYLE